MVLTTGHQNAIVIQDEDRMTRPVDVKALPNFRMWLQYDDGTQGEIDLSDRIAIDTLAVISGTLPP